MQIVCRHNWDRAGTLQTQTWVWREIRGLASSTMAGKFKSAVILCDMKQVCDALSEDVLTSDVKHMLCFNIPKLYWPLQECWTVQSPLCLAMPGCQHPTCVQPFGPPAPSAAMSRVALPHRIARRLHNHNLQLRDYLPPTAPSFSSLYSLSPVKFKVLFWGESAKVNRAEASSVLEASTQSTLGCFSLY
jgi:hypothetical protein